MASLRKIVDSGLCLGCGLCSAVTRRDVMRMSPDGFLVPDTAGVSPEEEKAISEICPSVHLKAVSESDSSWGPALKSVKAWAADPETRFRASSGGLVSALSIYLLETGQVDAVLHVKSSDGLLKNELGVSRTRDEVLSGCASRYAPAAVFDRIREIMDSSDERYCFIGKPCDIAGFVNFEKAYPEYRGRVRFRIAIFCAGVPSASASMEAVRQLDYPSGTPAAIRYRGEGWPGLFSVRYSDGEVRSMSYGDSWGKVLGRSLGLRCKICPDGTGALADISAGDAWETANGYPDFTERDGINFAIARSESGLRILSEASDSGYIVAEEADTASLEGIQPSQYQRNLRSPWRILGVRIATGIRFDFGKYASWSRMRRYPLVSGIKECLGTVRRCISHKGGKR
ncbi:MAG: Coenzyme F420 hydrogenase/dehydrogenase, beta subunit C-terminal domain [Bacteroidales bacterium]|nr:Coenzyme F420 hydrogenase/dehydrogenase, beta subunit C-terminal domain [Bacteroidales bacterium]